MAPVVEVSRSPVPDDAFSHPGKWVATRDGSIVAAADTLEDLNADPAVLDSDGRFRVPESDSHFF